MPICLPSFAGVAQPASGGTPFANQYSVSLDGTDDYVSTSSFDLTTNKTVSFWIKLNSISAAGVYLFGSGGSYYSYITANGQTMYKYDGSVAKAINISAANAISTGSWQHIVITGDGSSSVLYKNGTSIGTGLDLTPLGLNRFGGDSVGGSRFIDGLMDEVAVWDATLSADDVTAIYNSGVPTDLSSVSSYDTDRTSNLVHWWRMGENDGGTGTTITDQGSGGNNGTLTNGPTFSTSVPEYVFNQYSVSLDGTDDYIQLPNGVLSTLTGTAYTISMWYNLDIQGSYQEIFTAGSNLQIYFRPRFTQVGLELYINGASIMLQAPPYSNVGSWLHGCFSVDTTGTSTMYINGSSNVSSSSVPQLTSVSNPVIGSFNGASNFLNGYVDEVAIFNSALSASDVSDIYNSGVPADLTSLSPVNWWRMGDNDGATGTTITDQGSGGNNGTLTNGPTFSTTVPS